MTVHPLKTWPEYFKVVGREKTFEIRKNDRNFQVGDILWLQEWSEEKGYTGRDKKFTVTYLMIGGQFGIEHEYCIMGLGSVFEKRDIGSFDLVRGFNDIFSDIRNSGK